MDFLIENAVKIILSLGAICSSGIAIISFIKSIKSEKRTIKELEKTNNNVIITRQGIVQAFKDGVINTDLKVSVNKQVSRLMAKEFEKFEKRLAEAESQRNQAAYWALKILGNTAANNKLSAEERSQITELLEIMITQENICETSSE